MPNVIVVRLGHRQGRDQRITTHVFLAGRALGASSGVLCGDRDESVIRGITRVSELWGGSFAVKYEENWKRYVLAKKKQGAVVVHLTMYGEKFEQKIHGLSGKDLVVLVGAGKVPREAYDLSDFNLSVSSQPHSEISALALFLDRVFAGKELNVDFNGKMKIVPNKCGKEVVRGTND
ncbi:TPA: tRNA (cytidine(56)-2'-O)-methyltransferase [Candidatus Micrarchaeota archaeon]|nr:tRNA (cytidine(56)-2'-O)-methyltransferase [Candidatus Micrarchaeota archaeon]HIH30403.1 tRNA (cytidine(56)-2'-O)-methyltransferase [Candidatus Micrarchaeota archaeon]